MLITTLVAMLTEKGVACDVCVTLLGIYAVEDAKNASDHRLGMVRWGFDLGWRVVSICFALDPLQGSRGLRLRVCRAHHRG